MHKIILRLFIAGLCLYGEVAKGQEVFFPGGIGSGSSSSGKTREIQLSGVDAIIVFGGRIGYGSSSKSSGISFIGGPLEFYFNGGSGYGSIQTTSVQQSLNGIPFDPSLPTNAEFFKGGSGYGTTAASSAREIRLNGEANVLSFFGGIGFGSANNKITGEIQLSGVPYILIYAGGSGLGSIQKITPRLTLNGVLASGFSRIALSDVYDIKVIREKRRLKINWKSDNVHRIEYFEVQRSLDGEKFSTVGYVSNSLDAVHSDFSFVRSDNPEAEEFYRLLQAGTDSSFSFSPVLKLSTVIQNESFISVYPNPVESKLNLILSEPDHEKQISIFDFTGRQVKSVPNSGLSKIEILTDDLPSGVFWIEVKNSTSKSRIQFTRQ